MKSAILIGIFLIISCLHAQESPLIMHPSLSPDGQHISFSYQGDIWTMSLRSRDVRRLTIHEAYDGHPQWSPNGQKIIFQSNRYGHDDIFVMDIKTSSPKRLTYHSSDDEYPQWIFDDEILFASRRRFSQVEREDEIFTLSVSGGTPQRLLNMVGLNPAPSTFGPIAVVRGTCRTAREAYTGPANRNIWTTNASEDFHKSLVQDDSQDILPDWAGINLYFLSARDGRYNIFRVGVDANGNSISEVEQLTNYENQGIHHFDVSYNGDMIVFAKGGDVYTMSTSPEAEIQKLEFQLPVDNRFEIIEHKKYTSSINDYTLSPSEDQVILNLRGELFLKLNDKEKSRTVQITSYPYHDKDAVWVNDSTLLFSSDREGDFNLFRLTAHKSNTPLFESFKYEITQLTSHPAEEENLVISPDAKKLLFTRGRGQLILVDLDSLGNISNEKAFLDGWDTPQGVYWSPDSKWIAYGIYDLDFNREIYISPADQSTPPVNISLHPRGDFSPVRSPDGSKLGFLSDRNNDDTDVWFVWLQKSEWEKHKEIGKMMII